MLGISTFVSRRLGFNKEDEIAIVFCASKKSLASGVPMAKVLFSTRSLGMVILPLMLFHQIQLMICAVIAQRYARRDEGQDVPATTL
ncbi:hypothetical protein D3C81_1640360 [compost metagenome]